VQEAALVDAVVKTKLLLDSVDAWLLTQKTLINKRHRGVIAAVQKRNALVATMKSLLEALGLKRRTKQMPTLSEYFTARKGEMHTTAAKGGSQSSGNSGNTCED
jgi:hypothetical protein